MSGAVKVGNEFLLNTTTQSTQYEADTAALPNGGFVAVWADSSATNGDFSSYAIRAQVFGSSGAKVGAEVLVNTTTTGVQDDPTVTTLADGRFVVAWADYSGSGGTGDAVRAQIMNVSGTKSGAEFLVNSTLEAPEPIVASLPDGRFVMAWSTIVSSGPDKSAEGIRAQIFNPDTTKFGSEFQVNTTTPGVQFEPDITVLSDGHFVVMWTDSSATGAGDHSLRAVRAQVFDTNGAPVGSEFLVNTATIDDQRWPSVTSLADGKFVATWMDLSQLTGDTDHSAVRAQIFNADGTRSGTEFLVNTTTVNDQYSPSITGLPDGRFVVAWTDASATGGDTSLRAIRAQVFNHDGTKSGSEFLVNTSTNLDQFFPTVTTLSDGRFVVSWTDNSQTGADTSSSAVRAQIFDPRETPHITSNGGAATATVVESENAAGVTTVTTDSGGIVHFSLAGGADASQFHIDATTGALSFITAPNFEVPTDSDHNNSYNVVVRATAGGLSGDQTLTVNVANVNEAPVIASAANFALPENTSLVAGITATDPDAGTTLTYSITGGSDASAFQINASTGVLSFVNTPNFEAPADSDHNNVYVVQVRASDGALHSDQTIMFNIVNVNEFPVVTSAASVAVPENTTAVTTVTAADPEGDTLTYSITGGTDAAAFQINAATGALSFVNAPDFEMPADSDHNNSYVVQVRAFDGVLSADQTITVSVTDANEAPPSLHWAASVDVGAHPAGWLPSGIGDFNDDGTSDLAWFNPANGDLDIWKLQNGQWSGSADVGAHPAGYQPAGFGDFNHDGTSDVIWYNSATRDLDLWKIANGQWAGSVDIGTHPAGYAPVATGDFNGDGTSDVAWYNAATGDLDIWKISNGQWAGSADLGAHPAGYAPVAAGDFNGDGTRDIAWYNAATGDLDVWKISNGQWAGSTDLGAHPGGWQPLGAGDFNHDGVSDIAWYNPATNDIDVWLIQNGHWAASVDLGSHPAGAVAVGVGDFDHNGVADIMWRDTGSGHVENWLLAYS